MSFTKGRERDGACFFFFFFLSQKIKKRKEKVLAGALRGITLSYYGQHHQRG
jgi:hypothetical protein